MPRSVSVIHIYEFIGTADEYDDFLVKHPALEDSLVVGYNPEDVAGNYAKILWEKHPPFYDYFQVGSTKVKSIIDDMVYFGLLERIRTNIFEASRSSPPTPTIDLDQGGSIGSIYKLLKNVFTNETSIETDDILKKYGNWSIVRYRVHRDPIQGVLKKILNTLTGGQFKKGTEQYDDVYHLYAIFEINDRTTNQKKYLLTEKRPNINWEVRKTIGTGKNIWSPNGFYEGLDNSYRDNIAPQKVDGNFFTLSEMLEGYMKKYPNSWYKYSALDNNCQVYIAGLLNAIGDKTLDSFILQDLSQAITPIAKDVAKGVTDLGSLFGRLFGAGGYLGALPNEPQSQKVATPLIRNRKLKHGYDLSHERTGIYFPQYNLDAKYSRIFPDYYLWDNKKANPPKLMSKIVINKYPENFIPYGQAL